MLKLLPDQSFYPSPTMAMQAPAETLAYVEKDGGPQHLDVRLLVATGTLTLML